MAPVGAAAAAPTAASALAAADSAAVRAADRRPAPALRDSLADAAAADSAASADTSARARALSATRARERDEREHPHYFDQPRWVMLRSLVVPGWGQLHNGSWLKAAAVATGEGWLGARLLEDQRGLSDLDQEVAAARAAGDIERENALIARYNDRLDGSVRRQWLLAGLLTYAVLDAYVDAHFKDFRLEFEHDPALPGGIVPGARVSFRWGF